MYAVTGITGQVGGAVATHLLAARKQVRAVVRDAAKAQSWKDKGCDMAIADMNDADALEKAFTGIDGAFVMLPPYLSPSKGFPEARAMIDAYHQALAATKPKRVVCLSTIGAQAELPSLLTQLGMMEKSLADLGLPIAFIRAAWFMENSAWDVAPAKENGVIPSFLQPLDKAFPMIATDDIGKVAAELLQESWSGKRIIELESESPVTPNDIAATFAKLLGRDVSMKIIRQHEWMDLFKSQGAENPTPRVQMLKGFNDGWIDFERTGTEMRHGTTKLETVLKKLVEKV